MSLTPASTAEIAMKSALNASAISRASVVLPTPGGPHRIIECGLPAANATASGLPGASRWRCPMTSSILFGRNRSASGVSGPASPAKRSGSARSLPHDVRALRRRERERVRRELRIALDVAERELRRLAERVDQQHHARQVVAKAEADARELRLARLRRRVDVFDAVLRASGHQREVL